MALHTFDTQAGPEGLARAHEQPRRQQQESARKSDHLFDTLLHRAFAGEL